MGLGSENRCCCKNTPKQWVMFKKAGFFEKKNRFCRTIQRRFLETNPLFNFFFFVKQWVLVQKTFAVLSSRFFFFLQGSSSKIFCQKKIESCRTVGVGSFYRVGLGKKNRCCCKKHAKQWVMSRFTFAVLSSQICIYKIGAQLWKQTWCRNVSVVTPKLTVWKPRGPVSTISVWCFRGDSVAREAWGLVLHAELGLLR